MGPRLGWRGDAPARECPEPLEMTSMGPRLGWRGDRVHLSGAPRHDELQWGHALVGVETSSTYPGIIRIYVLQWGHALVGVETPGDPGLQRVRGATSMGPRLGWRGDPLSFLALWLRVLRTTLREGGGHGGFFDRGGRAPSWREDARP